jgi:hypothetical protein
VLTNADVVAMVKAGLSAATIIAKIETSRTAFATDTQALIQLSRDGAPDEVVRAIVPRASAEPPTPPLSLPTPQPSIAATAMAPAWTPTEAKRIPRIIRFTMGERGGVLLLQDNPDGRTIMACEASLIIDDRELYAGPMSPCRGFSSVTLRWSEITSFCYHFDEVIPTLQVGRPWHGTLQVIAGSREYLVGLYTRQQFDELRGILHEYRGNIPERCGEGPGITITKGGGFPLVHPFMQYQKGKLRGCLGIFTLDEHGVRFEPLRADCTEPLVIPWAGIDHYCFEDRAFVRPQFTFFGTNGEEWNFRAPGPKEERTLRTIYQELVKAKPDARQRCD